HHRPRLRRCGRWLDCRARHKRGVERSRRGRRLGPDRLWREPRDRVPRRPLADAAAANSAGCEQGLTGFQHFAEETMPRKRAAASVLDTIIGLIGVRQAIGENLCRPELTINEVEFSTMMPPTLERTWSAVVAVDASACTENSKGYFEIVFK